MKNRAVGYRRVSGKHQIDGESLKTQEKAIKDYIDSKDWKLTEMYSDEGISGASIKKRMALQRLMRDAEDSKFDVLVIHRLSRFGRNARDLLNNVAQLKEFGVSLVSLKEAIDLSTPYGRAMFTMLGAIAELEREIIGEQTKENRVAKVKQLIPSVGRLPFARAYDKKTGKWSLDEEKADLIRWAAMEYINGKSLTDLAHELRGRRGLDISYRNLLKVLNDSCGDKWPVKFRDEEPVVFSIPPILEEKTIRAVHDRIGFNRTNNRKDVNKYTLTGFIRCEKCGKSLRGQTQQEKYQYYIHPSVKYTEPCESFKSISLPKIENAIFRTIFENTIDAPAFQKAIKQSLPDEDFIKSLQNKITDSEKHLKRIQKDLDNLVNLAMEGTLRKSTIKKQEDELYRDKARLEDELEKDVHTFRSLPDPKEVAQEAEWARQNLMLHFGSEERLDEMNYEDKRRLLHFLFDGTDDYGTPWGIYLSKNGLDKWDYFIYGRLFAGVRTMKGNDIDYGMPHTDWNEYFRNCKGVEAPTKKKRPKDWEDRAHQIYETYWKNRELTNYKTNASSLDFWQNKED